jgi:hypothetical protein
MEWFKLFVVFEIGVLCGIAILLFVQGAHIDDE